VGEAGIGKSRLCADFRASEIAKRTTVLEGRALSSGRNLSYWPIIEVVRGWASVAEEDSEEVALDKLEAAVRAVAPDRCEEVVAYLEVLLGLRPRGEGARIVEGTSGETKAKLIARSCRELVAAAAGFRPLIFIVEDLHWADESTLEILKSLVGTVTDTQVMFLLVFRPGFGSTLEAFRQAVAERCPGRLVTIDLPPPRRPGSRSSDPESSPDPGLPRGGPRKDRPPFRGEPVLHRRGPAVFHRLGGHPDRSRGVHGRSRSGGPGGPHQHQ
jgi:hypothetical protein